MLSEAILKPAYTGNDYLYIISRRGIVTEAHNLVVLEFCTY